MTTDARPSGSPPVVETVWDIVRLELTSAPRKARAVVFSGLGGVVLMVVFAVVDTVTGSPGDEPFRLIGFVITAFGLLLHTVVQTLRGAATRWAPGAATPSALHFHRVLLALPALALVATASAAVAAGMMIPSLADGWEFVFFPLFPIALGLMAGLELVAVSRFLYEEAERRGRRAESAESEAARARLAALQAQLNPHFLFNALNTVASLVRTDGRRAERTVLHLADVLRRTLERSERPTCAVREEMDYLQAYLGIEKERWGEALTVEWRVSPDVLDASIPTMSLQPLVENALVHGLGGNIEGGHVRIEAARRGDRLDLTVADNGAGWAKDAREGTGIGNLRRRLATLYGEAAALRIAGSGGETRVTVEIPAWGRNGESGANPDR